MTTASAAEINASVWQGLYAAGRNDLRYPNEQLVRLFARYFSGQQGMRVLDFGFGTGANVAHIAALGHEVHGVEVSSAALQRAHERLAAAGLPAQLELVAPGAPLPYPTQHFDVVVAWQVLYYNDVAGWTATVRELERVTRPGGRILVATAAPGDISQVQAEPLGAGVYRSQVPGQEGCIVTIPGEADLARLFPQRSLELGEFGHTFAGVRSHHWIITYGLPSP